MTDEVKNMFDKISKKYDFMNNIVSFGSHYDVKKKAVKALKIKPHSKVLDLCCGSGDLGRIIKELNPTCDVVGVDFSSNMIDIARERNRKVTYWQADAKQLPFEKNSFDYVVMGFGLRNIPEKNKAIEEIYRVLKKNGEFLHLDFGETNLLSKIFDAYVLFIVKFFVKNTKPYRYLIMSKNRFLSPLELIDLFKFNRLEYQTHKSLMFGVIAYQIMKKI